MAWKLTSEVVLVYRFIDEATKVRVLGKGTKVFKKTATKKIVSQYWFDENASKVQYRSLGSDGSWGPIQGINMNFQDICIQIMWLVMGLATYN